MTQTLDGRDRDETYYRTKLAEAKVPEKAHDTLIGYLMHGHRPGHFLTGVLSNDLKEACGRADADNQVALYRYVYFLFNYAPSAAWGDPEKVTDWIKSGGESSRGR